MGNYTQHRNTQKTHKLKHPLATLSSLYGQLATPVHTCCYSVPSKCMVLPTVTLWKAQGPLQKHMNKSLKVEPYINSPCSTAREFAQVTSTDSQMSALKAMLWVLLQPLPLSPCLSFLFTSVPWGNWFSRKTSHETLKQSRVHSPPPARWWEECGLNFFCMGQAKDSSCPGLD